MGNRLSWEEMETKAVAFQAYWKGNPGRERQDANRFEFGFMDIFGIDWRSEGLNEYQIIDSDGRICYIDYLLPGKILIEMKSPGQSLIAAYNQGMHYIRNLPADVQPELFLVSDFVTLDLTNRRTGKRYQSFKLNRLKHHLRLFAVVAGYTTQADEPVDLELNVQASYKMAQLHDALKEHRYAGRHLELYLIRLLFCLFAEDTGIFEKGAFEAYLNASKLDGSDLSSLIMQLFDILDTPEAMRMPSLQTQFQSFRYINGHVFSERLPSAWFDAKMRDTLIACCDFNWSKISPDIFGSLFQSVMDPVRRRELGAHYTSRENILKVINPLFMNQLREDFEHAKTTKQELQLFQKKLAQIVCMDPACGSGNFLITAYKELRELELAVMLLLYDNKQWRMVESLSMISINQFYGIEYDEFASQIAQLSLLLVKHQMDQKVSHEFGLNAIEFPIRDNPHIVYANALRIDWADVVSPELCTFIFGNPPFVGSSNQSSEQTDELKAIYLDANEKPTKTAGLNDYVAAWYYKASEYMAKSNAKTAFVSTNSICQGEQVQSVWEILFQKFSIHIDFAYRTFKWTNAARGQAAVHCIIVGFSTGFSNQPRRMWNEKEELKLVENINAYLAAAPDIFISGRSKPLCQSTEMVYGNKPADGGHLLLSETEKDELLARDPRAKDLIRPFLGAEEYLHNIPRYCLWLDGVSPSAYIRLPAVRERIEKVRQKRLSSKKAKTRQDADTPWLFQEIRQPSTEYILVPRHSSEKRQYIPMGYIDPNVICGDANLMIPNASLYEFGVLTSAAHMAWMRAVCGRLKSDFRYSAQIVYNNFPWPEPTKEQREKITHTAQQILDARELYKEMSLAELYDPLILLTATELLKAHQANNIAVREAYGARWESEDECVSFIMVRYQDMVEKEREASPPRTRRVVSNPL